MRRVTGWLSAIAMMGGAAAAWAQPIIIPIDPQKQPQQPQAVVSAPPVAPPQAGPSLPTTTDTAAGPRVAPQEETASQPPAR